MIDSESFQYIFRTMVVMYFTDTTQDFFTVPFCVNTNWTTLPVEHWIWLIFSWEKMLSFISWRFVTRVYWSHGCRAGPGTNNVHCLRCFHAQAYSQQLYSQFNYIVAYFWWWSWYRLPRIHYYNSPWLPYLGPSGWSWLARTTLDGFCGVHKAIEFHKSLW